MACVQNPTIHGDSEREEGEIVDDLDELSDISSEEEFLLRQRLHMLEKYNNVLERKNAKRTTVARPGTKYKDNDAFLCDLSEISATELEEPYLATKDSKEQKPLKSYHKPKRRKDPQTVNNLAKRVHRKKSNKTKKRATVLNESSDESDDEYRNKRRKLAVAVNKGKVDNSTLKARLEKMLCGSQNPEPERFFPNSQTETQLVSINNEISLTKINSTEDPNKVNKDSMKQQVYESVDLCSDIDTKDSENNGNITNVPTPNTEHKGSNNIVSVPPESFDTVDSPLEITPNVDNVIIQETQNNRDSDEDLELLREHALKTKTAKTKVKVNQLDKNNIEQSDAVEERDVLLLSGEEDSDTAELRLICLKSALLKKAFERKQKQKLRKRLSQSLNLNDELMRDQIEYMNQMLSDNNTDIESVDMDIGSDGDEKSKDSFVEPLKPTPAEYEKVDLDSNKKGIMQLMTQEDEFEEDEDLLRAKLLTSLSKNLPNLVHPNAVNSITEEELPKNKNKTEKQANNIPEKKFIISLGNSDSEGEHEATKNLTKMHMKLSEQADFQQKLDMFLKSTRMEVEKGVLPDVVQQPVVPPVPKPKEKFVPKTVNHLPKSEQIEYKNLVKRMAELEKIKNARQLSINPQNTTKPKETLQTRNFSTKEPPINKDLEEQIALSRKTIAEESAKVLKLKDEATKLSHKYKIVSTELRNLATAITLNKKQQKVAQIKLSKIRTQHQLLINSTSTSKHSIHNGNLAPISRGPKKLQNTTKRPQKENAPVKDAKSVQAYSPATLSDLQSVTVSVVNDRMEDPTPILSVQVDVMNNKKTVKLPSPVNSTENDKEFRLHDTSNNANVEVKDQDKKEVAYSNWGSKNTFNDDYKSPLQALGTANWDPNAVLCRFEVGGNCKDPDCKYLHPKKQEQ